MDDPNKQFDRIGLPPVPTREDLLKAQIEFFEKGGSIHTTERGYHLKSRQPKWCKQQYKLRRNEPSRVNRLQGHTLRNALRADHTSHCAVGSRKDCVSLRLIIIRGFDTVRIVHEQSDLGWAASKQTYGHLRRLVVDQAFKGNP